MGLFLNGGKLLVRNGALSQTAGCCCGTPEKPCWCSSICSYTFNITGPAGLEGSHPPPGNRCYVYTTPVSRQISTSGLEAVQAPFGFLPVVHQNSQRMADVARDTSYINLNNFNTYWAQQWADPNFIFPVFATIFFDARLRVFCSNLTNAGGGLWRFIATFQGQLNYPSQPGQNLGSSWFLFQKTQRGTLSSACAFDAFRHCGSLPPSSKNLFLSTPLSFTLGASSVSLAVLEEEEEIIDGGDHAIDLQYAEVWKQFLLNCLAASPPLSCSITSVPSCSTTCCCLDGVITEIAEGEDCSNGAVFAKPDAQEPCAATGVRISYCGRQLVADFADVGGGTAASGYEDFSLDDDAFFLCPIDGESYPFNRLNIQCQVYSINACNKCYYSVNARVTWFSEQAGVGTKEIVLQTGRHEDDTVVYFFSEECDATPLWKRSVGLTPVETFPVCVDCYNTVPIVELLYAP